MLGSTLLLALLALLPTVWPEVFPQLHPVTIDADPENMLSSDEPVRQAHNRNKEIFGLHDGMVLGVVNEKHREGVFNAATLRRVHALTEVAVGLEGVVRADVMAPSTVDAIEHAGPGTVRFDWLMPGPPADEEEALAVRDRIRRIPFFQDTLVSADGRALAIYLPLEDKHLAHDVATALEEQIAALGPVDDEFHIAGLPVAETTFGVEMFKQMAISAPLAMLVIFLLMWLFFRKLVVIAAPMIVAMVSAASTVALLVVSGHTIHIMSSMIPIFVMPIAVLDAVHIISDFFDRYQRTRDRRATIEAVMEDLSAPMLFTSLTTGAGFLSLALTPIPPVQVFGIFVGIGVVLAWAWTVTFVPAYIVLLGEERLAGFGALPNAGDDEDAEGALGRLLAGLTFRRARWIVAGCVVAGGVAAFGISRIEVNDNPTRWFEADHPIRVADRVLNSHFGGTYNAYLRVGAREEGYEPGAYADRVNQHAGARAAAVAASFDALAAAAAKAEGEDAFALLDGLDAFARERRRAARGDDELAGWSAASGFLLERLDDAEEAEEAAGPGATEPFDGAAYRAALAAAIRAEAAKLAAAFSRLARSAVEVAATLPDTEAAFREALRRRTGDAPPAVAHLVAGLEQRDEIFKDPATLAWVAELQEALDRSDAVGKTSSLVDIVKTVHRDLLSGSDADYRIPSSRAVVAQTLEQYTSSHRKDDLWHFVTPSFEEGLVWLQLRSGDNRDMEGAWAAGQAFVESNPSPPSVQLEAPEWFGLTWINVVWQQKMVSGMAQAFAGSFLVVLVMMIALFRSVLWGILSMVPLTLTVAVIYGITGLVGKDYDMPVAVLSSLSLGLAVDYAIHFLARSRQLHERKGSWDLARRAVFQEPARAIGRNIVVIGVGFLPLLLAPLVPYQTVGLLIAAILLLAGGTTLILLPALIALLQRRLFKPVEAAPSLSKAA